MCNLRSGILGYCELFVPLIVIINIQFIYVNEWYMSIFIYLGTLIIMTPTNKWRMEGGILLR